MSIEQTDVIDIIGVHKESGRVILTISDHLDWTNESAHLLLLQQKINAYVAFIESGEIAQSYPPARNRTVVIDVVAKHAFTPQAQVFYSKAKAVLMSTGIELAYRNI